VPKWTMVGVEKALPASGAATPGRCAIRVRTPDQRSGGRAGDAVEAVPFGEIVHSDPHFSSVILFFTVIPAKAGIQLSSEEENPERKKEKQEAGFPLSRE